MKLVNAGRKVDRIVPFIAQSTQVLDFGCGDMLFAKALKQTIPAITITGIDVVDFGVHMPGIPFKKYNGTHIPFKNKSFDIVIAWHVFHHTDNPSDIFAECMRVARKRLIFVEPVYRSAVELPGMAFMDWVFNVWKTKSISMTYSFHSRRWWEEQIAKENGILKRVIDVEILPTWLPTGRSLLFVVDKRS